MNSTKVDLKLAWCSHKAAKFAVKHWHYSRTVPVGKTVKIGCWEDGRFIGVIMFGDGVCGASDTRYGIDRRYVAELVRIALKSHKSPVSKMIPVAIRFLKKQCPKLKLLVSFADTAQDHLGIIYQATNWIYTGVSLGGEIYKVRKTGRLVHDHNVTKTGGWGSKFGRPYKNFKLSDVDFVRRDKKHRYLYPLDKATRRFIEPLAQPYPKRATDGSNPVQQGVAVQLRPPAPLLQ